MPQSHGKQKQQAKQKKKRDLARRSARKPPAAQPGAAAMVRTAAAYPHGPSFISAAWKDSNQAMPMLVTVLVTRAAPHGLFVPAVAMVDRTCLGVKNGFVGRTVTELDLRKLVATMSESTEGIESCDLLVAQSVVYHALDYARKLGFEPQRDFPEPLFGPRPARLLDTPLARPSRPVFVPGPSDDLRRIYNQLVRAVGVGNFDFAVDALDGLELDEFEEEDDEDEDDEE